MVMLNALLHTVKKLTWLTLDANICHGGTRQRQVYSYDLPTVSKLGIL